MSSARNCRLAVGEATALLAQVPARLAAPVLEAMLPAAAARCVELLPVTRRTLALARLRTPALAAILRHLAPALRGELLEALPTVVAFACRTLLRYPADAVGALVDVGAVTLSDESRAAEALEAVRRADAAAGACVCVVADGHRLSGVVPLAVLLRADPGAPLAALRRPTPALAALMPVTSAGEHPGWLESDVLPVVEHGGRLLGVLQVSTLRRALAAPRAGAPADARSTVTGTLAEGYWVAIAALCQALVTQFAGGGTGRP